MESLWLIVHVMICHPYKESKPCVSNKACIDFAKTAGFKGKSTDCGCFFFYVAQLGWTGGWQQIRRSPRSWRWQSEFPRFSSFSSAGSLCALPDCLLCFPILIQGRPGDRGERGEPGDPGQAVSKVFFKKVMCSSFYIIFGANGVKISIEMKKINIFRVK